MTTKRKYIGWGVVKETVFEEPDKTAPWIAKEYGFSTSAVRAAAKAIGIKLPVAPRGGKRYPCNQWHKKNLTAQENGTQSKN